MLAYLVRRVLWGLPVLILISLITFLLMHAVPGGPFDREKKLPPQVLENLNRKYHLDEPLWKQYLRYMWGVLRFDFGPTYSSTTRTVNDIFREQFPVSAHLGLMAVALAVGVGIPLGVIAALKQNSIADYTSMVFAVLGVSIPSLALGPFLMWLFAIKLKVLPAATWQGPIYWILPTFTLGTHYIAYIARLTRASMLEVWREDYIRTARAKGLGEGLIVLRHALRNGLIPVVTVLGPIFAAVVTGTLIVEQIFGIPGLGKFYVQSIGNRDYPVIMGTTLLYGFVIVVANILVDISYAYLDPRIRLK
ncbi:MAG: ABC transporter permease [Dehalococcoidia bacterium]